MGSLMSGWDSPRSKKTLERNKSLLNEEIENFWTIKRKAEEEHMKALSEDISNTSSDDSLLSELGGSDSQSLGARNPPKLLEISTSFVSGDRAETQSSEDAEKTRNVKLGWWTRSNSAFLNDPPPLI